MGKQADEERGVTVLKGPGILLLSRKCTRLFTHLHALNAEPGAQAPSPWR